MVDLRKDKRAPASLKVKYKSATVDEFRDQIGTDISRGGIFIKTKKPIENGAVLKLELQLSDASPVIHGIGRVCWRREQSTDPELPSGMGIKFIKLDPSSRAVVERIIQGRGDRPSRFDQTIGAELAPPSQPPPSAATPVAPKPSVELFGADDATLPSVEPKTAVQVAIARATAAQAAPTPRAPTPQVSAAPRAPFAQTTAAPRVPVAAPTPASVKSATPRAPVAPAPAASRAPAFAPAPQVSAAPPRAPAPAAPRAAGVRGGDLPPPPASMLRGGTPSTSAKPAPVASTGSVAGLFANSPLVTTAPSIEPNSEGSKRSSFFPPAPSANGADSVRPSVPGFTGSGRLKPPSSVSSTNPGAKGGSGSLKPATRADQARQSGQFLATAFATGGLAEETATQAREVAERGDDSMIDNLFAGVERGATAEPSSPGNVEDMFAALSHEEGLSQVPAGSPSSRPRGGSSPGLTGAGRDSVPSAAALRRASLSSLEPSEASDSNGVDELFDELDARGSGRAPYTPSNRAVAPDSVSSFADEQDLGDDRDEVPVTANRSWSPEVGDNFGEADLFDRVSVPPTLPLNPEDAGVMPQGADAEPGKRGSSLRYVVLGLVFAVIAAVGFFLYQRSVAPGPIVVRKLPERPAAEQPAPAAVAPAQPSANPAPAPVGQAPASAAPQQAAANPAAAAAPVEAAPAPVQKVEIEVSSVPRDSDITVDGQRVGTTPKHVALPVGREARVTVSTSGYATITRTVVASPGSEPLRFKLEPLPFALIVHSVPEQAVISAGSRSAIAPAPLDLGHLEGVVQISVSKDGYQRVTRSVRIDEFVEKDGMMRLELDVALNALPPVTHSHSKHVHSRTGADAPPAPEPSGSGEAVEAAPAAAPAEAAAAPAPAAKPAAEAPAPAAEPAAAP